MARSLISNGQGYIFKAWPKPGVNDDAKRRLLTAAAAHMQGAGEAVEKERLSKCLHLNNISVLPLLFCNGTAHQLLLLLLLLLLLSLYLCVYWLSLVSCMS